MTKDWMIYKDRQNRIHLTCGVCGYTLPDAEKEIPDTCPRCRTRIFNEDKFYAGREEERKCSN